MQDVSIVANCETYLEFLGRHDFPENVSRMCLNWPMCLDLCLQSIIFFSFFIVEGIFIFKDMTAKGRQDTFFTVIYKGIFVSGLSTRVPLKQSEKLAVRVQNKP